ncbi:MAG TPA: bifunctional diguanylate cyclase/phosphodiesterase, partial [Solirubrobacteraceae bacterium]|nr:bifunctional diguanylate cyclase/phosphodiesterase [Solirubrobacteraceae bacterium]
MAAAEPVAASPVVLAPTRYGGLGRPLLTAFVAATIVVATAVATPLLAVADRSAFGEAGFWALAGFVLLAELFPIRLPRRDQLDEITLSTPFAFAVLLAYGPAPAIVAYAAASIVQDVFDRTSPPKVAFNAGQYALAIAAGAGVLAAAGAGHPAQDEHLPAILAAGVAMFAVNHVLVGVATALATHRPALRSLAADLRFQAWTAGFQLTLGPIIFAVAERNLALVPLLFFPLLAIHVGGRQAVLNQHRAQHDELTELPNRRLYGQRLHELVDGGDGAVAVLLDLDDFKSVNDTLGHQHWDELLVAVARRLRASMPADATVARLGGDEFALLAEQSDLITRLTEKVLDDALGQCRAWCDDGLDLRVSVNLSARSLLDRELPALVARLLDRWSLPSSVLQVEVTESRLIADVPRARATLEALRRLGVAVAIDDFGTGFSSLAQLTRLPVDEIKI